MVVVEAILRRSRQIKSLGIEGNFSGDDTYTGYPQSSTFGGKCTY